LKRLLKIIIVAVLVGAIFAPASIAMAASGTRTLPSPAWVVAGGNFDVNISVSDFGAFGQVVETLPDGFSYVDGSATLDEEEAVDVDSPDIYFTLLAEDTTFSYTVTASGTAGTYTFSGILKDENLDEYPIGDQAQIIVPATRSMPSSVTAGGNFDVVISTFDYGAFGQVVETLPGGFSYVTGSCTLSAAAVDVEGQEVTFTLLEEDTAFSYTVKASSTAGTYTFDGTLKDENKDEYPIGGQDQITVSAAASTGGGGGGGAAPGTTYLYEFITSSGKFVVSVVAKSEDGICKLSIPRDTISLKTNGQRPTKITIVKISVPHGAPQNMSTIGNAYDLGPDGLTFDPPVTLTFTYDPASLPEGINEENLVIAYYDATAGKWVELKCVVDAANNKITASVSHFTTFAIIGAITPPPPLPAPAEFAVSGLAVSPGEVYAGESVSIRVLVANTGGESGSCNVTLKINGTVEEVKDVTVSAGLSKEVTFSVARDSVDIYSVDVNGLIGSFTVKEKPAPPPPPIPAEFAVSDLAVSPGEVYVGEPVSIEVLVANTGGESGIYEVSFKINGAVKEAPELILSPGASQKVGLTMARDVPGIYNVDVNGLTGSFTVKEKPEEVVPPGFNWPLIGGIIGAVIVVALVIIYFLRKRATA